MKNENELVNRQTVSVYLKNNFDLPDEQITFMLDSLSVSLNKEFGRAEKALLLADIITIEECAHAIKGSLLNAGVENWAQIARIIELGVKKKEQLDFKKLFLKLRRGVKALL